MNNTTYKTQVEYVTQNESSTKQDIETEDGCSTQDESMTKDGIGTEDDIKLKFDIKNIIARIGKLGLKEKHHILNILNTTNINYTKNSNGFFFNLLDVEQDVLEKICNCLDLIEKNSDILRKLDKRRNDLLEYYKNIIEERLYNNIQQKKMEYIEKLKVISDPISINMNKKKIVKKTIDTTADIDILIKEYVKSKNKYEKGSVYHRITGYIKLLKSNFKNAKHIENDENIENDVMSFYNENENIDEYFNDDLKNSDIISNEENIESLHDTDGDINSDFDESELNKEKFIKKTSTFNNKILDNDPEENFDDENEEDDEDDEDYIKIKKDRKIDRNDLDFIFFKNLLYKRGFEFNDNKNCLLVYESYIS